MKPLDALEWLDEERVEACHKLRADLKEHGLEHAVRLMTVQERGEARRLIRDALRLMIDSYAIGG